VGQQRTAARLFFVEGFQGRERGEKFIPIGRAERDRIGKPLWVNKKAAMGGIFVGEYNTGYSVKLNY